jgi:hypothetical protein
LQQTSISSFFFNNCASSARVSRKIDFSLVAVGLVGEVVVVAAAVVVVVGVEVGVESFIFIFKTIQKQNISSKELFE